MTGESRRTERTGEQEWMMQSAKGDESGAMELTYKQATIEAMIEEMERDERVFCMGEDLSDGGIADRYLGLSRRFGPKRVVDTPISETFIIGGAVGAAARGLRPVCELRSIDFMLVATDEVVNQVAKLRFMSGGQCLLPIVIRAVYGTAGAMAAQHSQSLEALYCMIPGLKVITPWSPSDAKGMLKAAIRDDNPVLMLERKTLFDVKGEIPGGDFTVPIGRAAIVRNGEDATVVTYSSGVSLALEAADALVRRGVFAEVLDLRSLTPLDMESVKKSVRKTGRLVFVSEGGIRKGGVGCEVAAEVAETEFASLKAPLARLGAPFVPVPFSPKLEKLVRVTAEDIEKAVMKTMEYGIRKKD